MQNAQEIYLGTIAKLPRDEQWQLANLIFEQLRRTESQAERPSVYDLLKSLPKTVRIEVQKKLMPVFELTVYFAKDYAFNRNILGRIGFLNRVLIGLNDYAGKLYLSRDIDSE